MTWPRVFTILTLAFCQWVSAPAHAQPSTGRAPEVRADPSSEPSDAAPARGGVSSYRVDPWAPAGGPPAPAPRPPSLDLNLPAGVDVEAVSALASSAAPTMPRCAPHPSAATCRTRAPTDGPALELVDVVVHPRPRALGQINRSIVDAKAGLSVMRPLDPRVGDVYFILASAYWERFRAQHGAEDRVAATRTLARLILDAPEHPRMDEVLYMLSLALDEGDRVRQVLMRLIERHPGSGFVPRAWGEFASYYDHEGDPASADLFWARMSMAGDEHQAFALYRRGWTLLRMSEDAAALAALARAYEAARARGSRRLIETIVQDMTIPYVRIGQPVRARPFFTTVLAPSDVERSLEALSDAYLTAGRWSDARTLAASELVRGGSCEWQTRLLEARACGH